MSTTAINTIIVRPKRHDKFIYYLNDNFDNHHTANRDVMYSTIYEITDSIELSQEALEYLKYYRSFVIFVDEKELFELEVDSKKELQNLREKLLTKPFDKDIIIDQEIDPNEIQGQNALEKVLGLFFKK